MIVIMLLKIAVIVRVLIAAKMMIEIGELHMEIVVTTIVILIV